MRTWLGMKTWALALLFVSGLGASAGAQTNSVQQPALQLPEITLTLGNRQVIAEVAATTEERNVGLMHRPSMPENRGMLFVFDRPGNYCFWMKDTLIPLTILFLDEQQRVVQVNDMEPLSETPHCVRQPALYALEVNQGWLVRQGLQLQLGRPGGLVVQSQLPLARFINTNP